MNTPIAINGYLLDSVDEVGPSQVAIPVQQRRPLFLTGWREGLWQQAGECACVKQAGGESKRCERID